jgi:hypothetical protein
MGPYRIGYRTVRKVAYILDRGIEEALQRFDAVVADVRREHDVVAVDQAQALTEIRELGGGTRIDFLLNEFLAFHDVKSSSSKNLAIECRGASFVAHHAAARGVDEDRARLRQSSMFR